MKYPQAHWDTGEIATLQLFSFTTQVSQHPDNGRKTGVSFSVQDCMRLAAEGAQSSF